MASHGLSRRQRFDRWLDRRLGNGAYADFIDALEVQLHALRGAQNAAKGSSERSANK